MILSTDSEFWPPAVPWGSVSGSGDRSVKTGQAHLRTVQVWRLAEGTPLQPPLDLPESVRDVAVHGNVIAQRPGPTWPFTSQRSRGPRSSCCSVPEERPASENDRIMGRYPVHQPVSRVRRRAIRRPDSGRVRDSRTLSGTSPAARLSPAWATEHNGTIGARADPQIGNTESATARNTARH